MTGLADEWVSRLRLMDDQLADMIAASDAHGDTLLAALLCDAREQIGRTCAALPDR